MSAQGGSVPAPVYLVRGDDETVLGEAVRSLVTELVGDADRALVVEELDTGRYGRGDGYDSAPVVEACQTLPFLTDRRVVVARQAGTLAGKDTLAPLLAYLADPAPTTSLVIAWERDAQPGSRLAPVPKALTQAIESAGGQVVDASVGGRPRDRANWIDGQLRESGLALDQGARQLLVDRLGGDVARLSSVLAAIESTFGAGARLGADDIEPYVGEAGDVAPWDLTDAIDRGDLPQALEQLHRMMSAGGRHALQVMGVLNNHYGRMLRLDGAEVPSEKAAADLLGIKGSTFPARKALDQARRLGSDRLAEMVGLLAEADLDLRGAKAWPDELVMEVLVARLANRSARRSAGGRKKAS